MEVTLFYFEGGSHLVDSTCVPVRNITPRNSSDCKHVRVEPRAASGPVLDLTFKKHANIFDRCLLQTPIDIRIPVLFAKT